MLKIGDFSKICRVPITALRYYAEHGLLTPIHIDPFTGYRYYNLDQLPQLNRILALRGLGMSLASIRRLLEDNVSPEELQGMLRLREAELEQEVLEVQMRLQNVRERLRQIEREQELTTAEVLIREVEAQPAFVMREVIPDGQLVAELLMELFATLHSHKIELAAAPMTIFHDLEFKEENLDIEVACPVSQAVEMSLHTASQRSIRVRTLEHYASAACTLHIGSYDLFADTYTALGRWIDQNGFQIVGQPHEIYLRPPTESVPALTEIYIPVEQKKE